MRRYHMLDSVPDSGLPVQPVYLRPGEIWFGEQNHCVRTLLGSCIAITLWHPGRRLGGMCHYLLDTGDRVQHESQPGYYAEDAIDWFARQLDRYRVPVTEIQAKVFGGAGMFPGSMPRAGGYRFDVARRNIDRGFALLDRMGVDVVARDVGGHRHRNLYFEVWSGAVWRQLGKETK